MQEINYAQVAEQVGSVAWEAAKRQVFVEMLILMVCLIVWIAGAARLHRSYKKWKANSERQSYDDETGWLLSALMMLLIGAYLILCSAIQLGYVVNPDYGAMKNISNLLR